MSHPKHKHPAGLKVLFMAEMWERLSFYGMRALLVLYLTKVFMMDDKDANALYATYMALVYATPIFGGMLADRLLGCRKAVILGGAIMVAGHFVLAFQDIRAVYLGLGLIIVGNGFFKPNISTIVGMLYEKGDSMRDAGFMIFYMGINVGAFLQIIASFLGEKVGWHYGFGFAGVGMVVGLIVFILGQKHLQGHAEPPRPEALDEKVVGIKKEWMVYLGTVAALFLVYIFLQHTEAVTIGMNIFGAATGIGLITYGAVACSKEERSKMFAALILIGASVAFWSVFEQAGSSMTLFADRNVDRVIFGFEIPASSFQSVNPAFIILLAIPFSTLWIRLAEKGKEPSTPLKFGLGIFQAGIGFVMLWIGIKTADNGMSNMIWLILAYFFHTTGELCVSPVGLSMVTKLSPKRIVSLMMGTWFLATAYSHILAGILASLMAIPKLDAENLPPASEMIVRYGDIFGKIAVVSLVIGVVFIVIAPLVRKMMREVH